MPSVSLHLTLLPGLLAVSRLSPGDPVPAWAFLGEVWSVTRTPDELSVVCREDAVPAEVRAERGWRCLVVQGPLDFGMTGVLASLAVPLAEAGVSIFAVSTFDTDHLMVKRERLGEAVAALRRAGHRVEGDEAA